MSDFLWLCKEETQKFFLPAFLLAGPGPTLVELRLNSVRIDAGLLMSAIPNLTSLRYLKMERVQVRLLGFLVFVPLTF